MYEALDPVFFAMLKDLRKKVAKKHKLPPYVIFQDISLAADGHHVSARPAGAAEYPGRGCRQGEALRQGILQS